MSLEFENLSGRLGELDEEEARMANRADIGEVFARELEKFREVFPKIRAGQFLQRVMENAKVNNFEDRDDDALARDFEAMNDAVARQDWVAMLGPRER